MGISISVTSIVSRSLGAKNIDKASEVSNIAIKIGIFLGVVLSAIYFIFAENILKIAGASDDVISLGKVYLKICSFENILNMLTNIFNGIYRGCKILELHFYGAAIM